MNKKYLTLTIIAATVIIATVVAIVLFNYYASFKKVTIDIQKQNLSVDIFKRDPTTDENSNADTHVATIQSSQILSLQAGKYYAVPKNDDYSNSQIGFVVADKDMTVTINPDYSDTFLSELLEKELPAITRAITTKYDLNKLGFTLNNGHLYEQGEWYATTLMQEAGPRVNGDVYRTILHKKSDKWEVVAAPQLILTAPENKGIPNAILEAINADTGHDEE